MFSFVVVVRVNIACAPNSALDVEDADVEKPRKTTADKCCAFSGATREPALFISSKSNLPFFDLGHSRRSFGHGRWLFFSAAADDDHK
jgi:hypothetical protein